MAETSWTRRYLFQLEQDRLCYGSVSFHIPCMVQPICCYRLLGKLSVIFTLFYNFCVEICNVTICTASVYSGGRGI